MIVMRQPWSLLECYFLTVVEKLFYICTKAF